jgi:hypothetical protein
MATEFENSENLTEKVNAFLDNPFESDYTVSSYDDFGFFLSKLNDYKLHAVEPEDTTGTTCRGYILSNSHGIFSYNIREDENNRVVDITISYISNIENDN